MKQNNEQEMIDVKLAYLNRLTDSADLGMVENKPVGCPRVWQLVEVDDNNNVIHTCSGYLSFLPMFYYLSGRIDAEERHTELIER